MRLDIRHNLPDVLRWAADVRKQQRYAMSRAINTTANAVREAERAEMRRVFDRPTPFVINTMRVQRYSSRDDLTAVVEPVYPGGKGTDPQDVLRAEISGGARKLKRSERAFQRAGILPAGFYIVPGEGAPLDAYGNIKGSFMVRLLSYFQAFGEQGYRANMTAKRKARIARRGVSESGFKVIQGVEYFVAYGKLRSGKTGHLSPGIYSRTGTHGVNVMPILRFVRKPTYRPRFAFEEIGQRTVAAKFGPSFRDAFHEAARTARKPGAPR